MRPIMYLVFIYNLFIMNKNCLSIKKATLITTWLLSANTR